MFERYLYHLRRLWWLLLLATILATGASFLYGVLSPASYHATATLLINQTQAPDEIVLDDVLLSERLTATYEQLIATRPLLEEVATRLEGSETVEGLRRKLHVSAVGGTQLVRVAAESDDADQAALIANTVSEVFIAAGNLQVDGARPGVVSIAEPAQAPTSGEALSSTARIAVGALAGAAIALMIGMGRTYFDTTLWEAEDLTASASSLPCLGVLRKGDVAPSSTQTRTSHLPSLTESFRVLGVLRKRDLASASTQTRTSHLPSLTESFRVLGARVSSIRERSGRGETPWTVAVVSALKREGRTSIVARLGMALALEGERVMLVDFDLRHPTLHDEFQLPNTSGIADLLGATSGALPHEEPQHEAAHLAAAGRKSAGNPIGSLLTAIPGVGNRYIHDTALIGLRVVPSGQYEGQAARQLSAKRVRIALECLKADKPSIILFDTPPLTEGAEAVILSQLLDSAVVVVEARRTPAHLVTSVASELDALRPTLLGAILNKQ